MSSPFYPRGTVRAIAQSTTFRRTATEVSQNSQRDDDVDAEDVIRPSEMEEGLRNLVLCASLNNMATISHGDDDKWAASGDATGTLRVVLDLIARC